MKQFLVALVVVVVIPLFGVAYHYYGGAKVPAGQPSLVSLTTANFNQLRTAFNAASGEIRIVLLLSPT